MGMLELDGTTLTLEQFREWCLKPNLPAIVRSAAALECDGDTEDGKHPFFVIGRLKSRLSPTGLIRTYGPHHRVPTLECVTEASPQSEFRGEYMECHSRSLEEVMEFWRRCERLLYVRDWHMQSDAESLAKAKAVRCGAAVVVEEEEEKTALLDKGHHHLMHGDGLYQVPDYLGGDWMDEFCRMPKGDDMGYRRFGDGKSDYRFAYIGPSGSWTPLHFDVFGTYSWSLNVCGEKLWFFPTPEGNQYLLESSLQGAALAPDIRVITGVELWTVVQRPGDLVFVPSQYLHQVHNVRGSSFSLPRSNTELKDTSDVDDSAALHMDDRVELVISINHNWCNEWCVERLAGAFCRDANRIGELLTEDDFTALFGDDMAAWHDHMERMLIGGTNWNFASIRSFLRYRLNQHLSCADADAPGTTLRHLLEKCLEKIDVAELCATHRCGV